MMPTETYKPYKEAIRRNSYDNLVYNYTTPGTNIETRNEAATVTADITIRKPRSKHYLYDALGQMTRM